MWGAQTLSPQGSWPQVKTRPHLVGPSRVTVSAWEQGAVFSASQFPHGQEVLPLSALTLLYLSLAAHS